MTVITESITELMIDPETMPENELSPEAVSKTGRLSFSSTINGYKMYPVIKNNISNSKKIFTGVNFIDLIF